MNPNKIQLKISKLRDKCKVNDDRDNNSELNKVVMNLIPMYTFKTAKDSILKELIKLTLLNILQTWLIILCIWPIRYHKFNLFVFLTMLFFITTYFRIKIERKMVVIDKNTNVSFSIYNLYNIHKDIKIKYNKMNKDVLTTLKNIEKNIVNK